MVRIISGTTTPGHSGPESDGNGEVLRFPQSSCTAGTSPSDCLVSYAGHSLWGFYPCAEVQSMYCTAPADWARHFLCRLAHQCSNCLLVSLVLWILTRRWLKSDPLSLIMHEMGKFLKHCDKGDHFVSFQNSINLSHFLFDFCSLFDLYSKKI